MTAASPLIERIGQILISVSDLPRAVAFYRDVLGLTFLFEFPGMAFFECGGTRLYLGVPEKPEFAKTSLLYYKVRDITEAHDRLVGRGVSFVTPPHKVHADARHELWLAFFKDTEGNHLALMSEVPLRQDAPPPGVVPPPA